MEFDFTQINRTLREYLLEGVGLKSSKLRLVHISLSEHGYQRLIRNIVEWIKTRLKSLRLLANPTLKDLFLIALRRECL